MADETEQNTPAEPPPEVLAAEPATSEPAQESAVGEEPSAPNPAPVHEVATEVTEPISQLPPATPNKHGSPPTPQTATPAPQSTYSILPPNDLALRGLAARRERKEAKLQKILELLKKGGSTGSIDVQKHLRVSDSTATRYLKELVKQGSLKRIDPQSRSSYQLP